MIEVEILGINYSCPAWAKCLAMDADDEWYAFEKKPTISEGGESWVYSEEDEDCKCERIYPVVNHNWRTLLYFLQ